MADRLRDPISEEELVSTLKKNILPDIQHELLHFDVHSIATLRRACHRRENFFQQSQTRFNFQINAGRRQISEVEIGDQLDEEVNALNSRDSTSRVFEKTCWNCEEVGHVYKECLQPRRVFCYCCGLAAQYLPTCINCSLSKNRSVDDYKNNYRHPSNNNKNHPPSKTDGNNQPHQ